MKSKFEIELEISKGSELGQYIKYQSEWPLRSKRREQNIIQHTDYFPPGKLIFYFILDRSTVFLSPKYKVARFKDTNVFFNYIDIESSHDCEQHEKKKSTTSVKK